MADNRGMVSLVFLWTTRFFAAIGFLFVVLLSFSIHVVCGLGVVLAAFAGMVKAPDVWSDPSPGLALAASWLRYALACLGSLFLFFMVAVIASEWDQRQRSNENRAFSNLRNYVQAQSLFFGRRFFAVRGNTSPNLGETAYADNYRNLYYGVSADGGQIRLISKNMADDFLVDNALSGAPTRLDGQNDLKAGGSNPQYYVYIEDVSGDLPASAYSERYALMAIPARLGDTGRYVLWVDQDGEIYRQKPRAAHGTPARELIKIYRGVSGSTPVAGAEAWERSEHWR